MLKIKYQTQFKRDLKKLIKQNVDITELRWVISELQHQRKLPDKYKDHKMQDSKKFKNCRDCHIEPDWVLIYRVEKKELVLELIRTGSHSEVL